jgi:regulator of protease activity HflC (stomatin/prohibitin superfamily)
MIPAPERAARLALIAGGVATALAFWLTRTHPLAALAPLQTAAQALACVAALTLLRLQAARRAEEETRSLAALTAGGEGQLFTADDPGLLPGVRTYRQIEAWLPPVAAPLLGLFLLHAAQRGWRAAPDWVGSSAPLAAFAITAGTLFALFLLSQYLSALAAAAARPLRAGANLAGLTFLLAGLAAASALAAHLGLLRADLPLARAGWVLVGGVGAEWVFHGLAYWYRARGARERAHPYESRLAGLLGDPGALVRDLARALDYQFGAGFSSSWFLRFLGGVLLPFAAAVATLHWLSDALVWLEPHETGLRQRAGRIDRAHPLGPGLHLKFPAPFETVIRLPAGRLNQVRVGFEGEEEIPGPDTLRLWTQPHYEREDIFLSARQAEPGAPGLRLDLLNVNVPVLYRITNEVAHTTQVRDPEHWMTLLAHRGMTRLLLTRDLAALAGSGLEAAGEDLTRRVQADADRIGLGVRVEFAGLHGAHPPLLVAAAYEKALAARQERDERIHRARGEAARTLAGAAGEAERELSGALAYQARRTALERAAAEGFAQQLAAFAHEPDVYRADLVFRTLEKALAGARLFLVPGRAQARVINLDLSPPPDPSLFEFHDPIAENRLP